MSRRRKNRRPEQDTARRVSRLVFLVHMGELSSARQALEGASLAPGSEATLNALRDPEKKPQFPRHPLPQELVYPEPEVEFDLDEFRFRAIWSAKKGAAGGPSGMTVEHFNSGSSLVGEAHSPSEAQWRGARDRGGGHREEDSGAHHVTTVDVQSPARQSTVPARVGDEEWMREHRSRSARFDRNESAHHCDFHRRNERTI